MTTARNPQNVPSGPVWQIATLYPEQGEWSESEYLALKSNRLVEYVDGVLEFPPMPTDYHQALVAFLYEALVAFVRAGSLGTVRFAPLRVRVGPRRFREPDVLFMAEAHKSRIGDIWEGADLVMEIVSGDASDRDRDIKDKRADYAKARIPEYWIVDPDTKTITVLRLKGKSYVVHGEHKKGGTAASALLKGFTVEVNRVFAAK